VRRRLALEEPPVNVPARWYHLQGREQHGPLDLDTMRRLVVHGTVTADTYVWADGMPDWLKANEVPALTPPEDLRADLDGWR
jgi:hypothetical protein